MKKRDYSRQVLVLLSVLLLVMGVLFTMTANSVRALNAINDAFYQLELQDDELELSLLKNHSGIVLHYDDLRYLNLAINHIYAKLTILLTDSQIPLTTPFINLQHGLAAKQSLIEQYKSDLSILKNATAFLPQQLDQLIAQQNEADKQPLMTLQRLFLKQFIAARPGQALTEHLQKLNAKYGANEQWKNIFKHINHAINKQVSVNRLIRNINNHPATELIDLLHNDYTSQLEFELKYQKKVLYGAYGNVLVLLLFCLWMLVKYRSTNRKMQFLNENLADEVDKATQKILKEKQKAEHASQAKSQFLTRMSHELRTPLNAIMGFTQIQQMIGSGKATEQEKQNNEQILVAGQHLLGLITDMLDLSALDLDSIDIKLENCDLNSLIEQSISMTQNMAQGHHITVNSDTIVNSDSSALSVIADSLRLKQVLINLLTNAIKYNKPDGNIKVTIEVLAEDEKNARVRIAVTDSGVGIAQSEQETIFEPFVRLDYAEINEIPGTGVGLSLTQFLVQQMHGSIGLSSEVDVGSTFWIEFPVANYKQPASPTAIEGSKMHQNSN
jgi:signal transduction histidine kinase